MQRLRRAVIRVEECLSILLMVALFAVVTVQVASRYVFARPLFWSEELATILFVWVVYLGSGIASRRRAHIAILLLPDRLPSPVREGVALATAMCSLAFSSLLVVVGLQVSLAAWDIPSPAIQIPLSWVYLAVPVGALAMIAWGVEGVWTAITERRR